MEFSNNQIVMLRNGIYGAVASFNNKPFQIVFKSYTTPTSKYDGNFKTKNSNYDVVKIFDGSKIEDIRVLFSSKFNSDNLEIIWEENK